MKKLLLIALLIMGCDNSTEPTDCAGTLYGAALVDDCGVCAGGTTGVIVNADKDCAGVCGGDEVSCPGCTDNTACNYNPSATEDDDSCINPDEIYGCDIFQEYADFETILITNFEGVLLGTSGDGISGECSGVSETGGMSIEFSISAFPNPFNPTTNIYFSIPQDGLFDLFIVNPNYERVITINSSLQAGNHGITWDGTDAPDGYYRAISVLGESKCFINLHKSN